MIEKINNDPFDGYDVPDRHRYDCQWYSISYLVEQRRN